MLTVETCEFRGFIDHSRFHLAVFQVFGKDVPYLAHRSLAESRNLKPGDIVRITTMQEIEVLERAKEIVK